MNRKLTINLLLAMVVAMLPGLALASERQSHRLAEAIGITEPEARRLMGWGPLTYAEFRADPSRIKGKVIRAKGKEFYEGLMAGRPMRVEHEVEGRKVAFVVRLDRKG